MDELKLKDLGSLEPYFSKSLMSWQSQLKGHGILTSLGQRIFCSAGDGPRALLPLCLPSPHRIWVHVRMGGSSWVTLLFIVTSGSDGL